MKTETTLYRIVRFIWYLFYFVETLLLFRFILKLLAANPGAAFTNLIYGISGVFVAPFQYVFQTNSVGSGIIEWSTLLAMLVYWAVAWGIVKLIVMNREVDHTEAERHLEMQDNA